MTRTEKADKLRNLNEIEQEAWRNWEISRELKYLHEIQDHIQERIELLNTETFEKFDSQK